MSYVEPSGVGDATLHSSLPRVGCTGSARSLEEGGRGDRDEHCFSQTFPQTVGQQRPEGRVRHKLQETVV